MAFIIRINGYAVEGRVTTDGLRYTFWPKFNEKSTLDKLCRSNRGIDSYSGYFILLKQNIIKMQDTVYTAEAMSQTTAYNFYRLLLAGEYDNTAI